VLDAHLATHSHIVGDRLTLADFDIASPYSQNQRTKIPLNECPSLVAWQQPLLDTVPAWAETKREFDDRIDSAHGGQVSRSETWRRRPQGRTTSGSYPLPASR
jgi:glutathione S-transferase